MSRSAVHPTAILEEGAELAAGVTVGPYAVIGPHVRIGPGCAIHAHAVLLGRTVLGEGNSIHSHAVVGGEPQDLKYRGEETLLRIGDRNQIREGVTINRGTLQGGGETVLGNDNLLMANCHVAHDCRIGNKVILANAVMLAGHVHIHDQANIGGGAGIHHFATVGRFAYVGGLARVTSDIPPFTVVEGHPGRPRAINVVGLRRAGYSDDRIAQVKEAFKQLFRADAPMQDSWAQLEAQYRGSEEVLELVRFLRACGGGRHGRQQEKPGRRHTPGTPHGG